MRVELTRFCLQDRCSTSWSYIAIELWPGREADAPLQTPRSQAVTVLQGMSHAPIKWWSELDSNQPVRFFRPALIHLSYPTLNWSAR